MFDRRWVTDVALAALIAFPAVLPATSAPRSAPGASTFQTNLAQPDVLTTSRR